MRDPNRATLAARAVEVDDLGVPVTVVDDEADQLAFG